jgi:hypothetical protein
MATPALAPPTRPTIATHRARDREALRRVRPSEVTTAIPVPPLHVAIRTVLDPAVGDFDGREALDPRLMFHRHADRLHTGAAVAPRVGLRGKFVAQEGGVHRRPVRIETGGDQASTTSGAIELDRAGAAAVCRKSAVASTRGGPSTTAAAPALGVVVGDGVGRRPQRVQ